MYAGIQEKFKKKNQIGIVPVGGYRCADNQSMKAAQWLFWMEQKILRRRIEYAFNSRDKRLIEGIRVDGYIQPVVDENHNGIVLQFHGCYWHGCPSCYRVNRDEKLAHGDSMDDRYESTCIISEKIRTGNYKLIEMWECAFDLELTENEIMRRYIEENRELFKRKPLDPRDAFFGGRTGNTVKVYECDEREKIKYVDVCSLYPYICKRGKYPIGHPNLYIGQRQCEAVVGNNMDITNVNGLILCDVLPPRNLYHPVLPVRMHGKLIFPLCRTCCEKGIQSDCFHEDPNDRLLQGTWVSEELKKAVEMGYVIQAIYEIWQYEMTQYDQNARSGGIFSDYIDQFFKQKVEASGYPPECVTEEDKDVYVKSLERAEGIRLNRDNIGFNAGLRSVAKLCLNSLWGKMAQRENMTKTEVLKDVSRLLQLLTSAEIEVNSILPVNDETLYIEWQYRSEALSPLPTTSVVVAAFTTAQARLKLFEYLNTVGSRALYYDTDSVFYTCKDGETELPIGAMLGDLTDEMSEKGIGTYITMFISGGPKFYAYKYKTPDGDEHCLCKVKGIRLNYDNAQKINFSSIREMITNGSNEIVLSSMAIRRNVFHEVLTVNETKTCKPVYGKRRFINLISSYPYGYKRTR